MEDKVFLALLVKRLEESLSALKPAENSVHTRIGARGPRGPEGRDGKDFVFSEHEEKIKNWAKEFALKFEDLTEENIEKLKGPRGQDGRDGKDFVFSEHEEKIKNWAKEFALKFEDLTEEDISKIRGPRGLTGKDGKDFEFEDSRERIEGICKGIVSSIKDSLKLKFSDLDADDIEKIRGPKGREGKDGKDFVFEEHRAFFEGLKPRFSDFTAEEVEQLKLKFSQLTEEEKNSLRIRFADLTEEQALSLKGEKGDIGHRGPRGQRGKDGKQGPKGLPGPVGPRGISSRGQDGQDGQDGKDAPYITEINIDESNGEIELIFDFSDGTTLRTNSVKLPKSTAYHTVVGGSNNQGPAVFALTDAATIVVNAALAQQFTVTLGGNRTLGNPTGAVDGDLILFAIRQDGTPPRTLTLDTKFRFGADITSITLSAGANKTDYLGVRYNGTDDTFDVISFIGGF